VISLKAYHEGGQVNIEVADDGAGVDVARLKQKALEKGLIRPEQAERMSEHEAMNLMFLPGFSTARAVTNVSGRGVGLDVVRCNVERIGGTVDVFSTQGKGTLIRLKIPLTSSASPARRLSSTTTSRNCAAISNHLSPRCIACPPNTTRATSTW
jgi:two-component system chemotaxis sensor kinase CheA